MLKKTITYTDFNGQTVTEDHYFHLSKADLIEMEMSVEGGFHDYLDRIVKANDGKTIISEFKKLLQRSYGKKSDDGKRFVRDPLFWDEFVESEAFSTMFMELITDATAASVFINGIVPQGLDQDVAKIAARVEEKVEPAITNTPRVLTRAEVTEMDSDELRHLIAEGATILGD